MDDDETNLQKRRNDAKLLYIQGKTAAQINALTGVPFATIKRWIYAGTDKERPWCEIIKEHNARMLEAGLEERSREISEIWQVTLPLVRESIVARAEKVDKDGKRVPLTTKEIRELTEAVTNLEGLRRLESGKTTAHVGQSFLPITIKDIHDAITKDVFTELIPLVPGVDWRTVSDGSKQGAREARREDRGPGDHKDRARENEPRPGARDPEPQSKARDGGSDDPFA